MKQYKRNYKITNERNHFKYETRKQQQQNQNSENQ